MQRRLLLGVAFLLVFLLGMASERYWPELQSMLLDPVSADANGAPSAPAGAHLIVDMRTSSVDLVDGNYVLFGEIVNQGSVEGSTRRLTVTFRKNDTMLGERSYPRVLGPIAPGGRLKFTQKLDDPPPSAVDIVPSVE
ncbi:MAG TPA: hypothetical protein VMI56_06990 [Reyranella sp.]|nr:hypothetical protein [Reyranella sp.]